MARTPSSPSIDRPRVKLSTQHYSASGALQSADMPDCVLGVDVGTTGARGVVFDPQGKQLYVAAADYPLRTPRPGWAEQDPAQVYEATTKCLREAAGWA